MNRCLVLITTLAFFTAGCKAGEKGSDETTADLGRERQAHAEHEGHEEREGNEEHEGHGEHEGPEASEESEEQGGDVVHLSPGQLAQSGIEIGPAGPHTIVLTQELPGEVVVNADRLAHVVPRFPGIAREVRKKLGDRVQAGEVMAIVESNESLSPYEVKSLIAGTVIGKHITLGEFVRDDTDVYVVADLSSVWVNVTVYARDLARVQRGRRVTIHGTGIPGEIPGTIDYVGPVIGEATRTAVARVVLPNPQGTLRPGLFVTATVDVEQVQVAVAVPDDAVQTVEGRTVVFVSEGDNAFEARPVVLGRTGDEWVEVVSGLAAGDRCVFRQSFILKSELGKAEASHSH